MESLQENVDAFGVGHVAHGEELRGAVAERTWMALGGSDHSGFVDGVEDGDHALGLQVVMADGLAAHGVGLCNDETGLWQEALVEPADDPPLEASETAVEMVAGHVGKPYDNGDAQSPARHDGYQRHLLTAGEHDGVAFPLAHEADECGQCC